MEALRAAAAALVAAAAAAAAAPAASTKANQAVADAVTEATKALATQATETLDAQFDAERAGGIVEQLQLQLPEDTLALVALLYVAAGLKRATPRTRTKAGSA